MNQYFVITPRDKNRYSLLPGFKQDNESHGFETFDSARRQANHVGGYVVKHYTREDYKRDYENE